MSMEEIRTQPVFDPHNVGASLVELNAAIKLPDYKLSGLLAGDAVSLRRGSGMEIDGTREYQPGDDTRHIDWPSTARSAEQWPILREHQADINPAFWVITDTLTSRYEANAGYFSEQQLALSAIMVMLKLASQQRLPSGLIAVNDHRVYQNRNLGSGRRHIFDRAKSSANLVLPPEGLTQKEAVLQAEQDPANPAHPENRNTLAAVLKRAGKVCAESVVLVVSDFRDTFKSDDEPNGWEKPLRRLARNQNDVIAIEVTNPWDFRLPKTADRVIVGGQPVNLEGRKGQQRRLKYEANAAEQQAAIDATLQKVHAKHIKLSTAEPRWFTSLEQQLRRLAR